MNHWFNLRVDCIHCLVGTVGVVAAAERVLNYWFSLQWHRRVRVDRHMALQLAEPVAAVRQETFLHQTLQKRSIYHEK